MLAQRLTETLGRSFIVENRPGATGTIASAFVAKNPPDGHTLIMHSSSSYTAGFLYRKLSYEAGSAFALRSFAARSAAYSWCPLPVKSVN